MSSLIVAKRYARALLDIGKEDGNMEKYGQDVAQMADLFAQAPDLESVLGNPGFAFDERQKVLETFLAKMGLSPIVNNFLKLLMDRGRIDATRDISLVYDRLVDEQKGVTRAEVSAAAALKDDEVDRLKQALAKMAGQEVTIEVKEDPSLIGGVVAKIGDLVLDGSVKTQLENLKESLRRGDYA